MVRNNELKPVGTISKQIARKVRELAEQEQLSQEDLGRIIGRSQSYTSLRVKGMKSWTIEELDKLAPQLGYNDAIELMDAARPSTSTPRATERFTLVAKHGDIEREQEMYNDLP